MNKTKYIHKFGDSFYFCCELSYMISRSTLEIPAEKYTQLHFHHQIDFLNCLINPLDDKIIYDMRIISQPDPLLYTRGRIVIGIVCRMIESSDEKAARYAKQLLNMIDSTFEEHKFRLADSEKIQFYLNPFKVKYSTEIKRRCDILSLDSLKQKKQRMGFSSVDNQKKNKKLQDSITYIYPYHRSEGNYEHLFKLLLHEPDPVLISCTLQPTKLPNEVAQFLEGQIIACERFAQIGIDRALDDLQNLYPTLQEQARTYQRHLTKLLFGLRDNSALMQVQVAAENEISNQIIDTLAAIITEPAGGKPLWLEENIYKYFTGGYETQELKGKALKHAVESLNNIEVQRNASSLIPESANILLYLFDSLEAGYAFRLPQSIDGELAGIETRNWRSRPIPKNLPDEGTLIGVGDLLTNDQPIRISKDDRRRHMYVVGQTGTGKTTILKSMILSDINEGEGLCVIDPHGDLFKEILGKIPEQRKEDVVVIDPTEIEYPIGLNMLELKSENERYFIVQEMAAIIQKLIEDEYGSTSAGQITGPVFWQHMKMNLLLVMSDLQLPGTLLDFHSIFQGKNFWKRWVPLKIQDQYLERWITNVLPQIDYTRWGSDYSSMGSYIGSKFDSFVFDPMLRNIFGQRRSTIDILQIMDEGKILLVNLAKGELSETNSKFLGMVLMGKIQAAAMERIKSSPKGRRSFNIYVDEFQSIATKNFITLLSEGRKFGVNLILANQFVSQVEQKIVDSVLGNVGTIISFRLGQLDAEKLEKEFYPVFNKYDLLNLPNWYAYISTLVKGQPTPAFTLRTILDTTKYDEIIADKVRFESQQKYGKHRDEVEKMISESFKEKAAEPAKTII
ncbi:MAG: type IV secretion system DNA-binding domain-containing protein [Bacteroidota bacterium]|nr:type IV secretion system DNA-binding domain-containing protein [Bacteroidota bacterium]